MTDPAFTILLPVHRPPAMLPCAIESVLAQERQDFELFVICDGAPPETAAVALEHADKDARICVFEHPKGARNGETYRHQALQEARGEYVCQISDDDLWLPNHLSEVAVLLQSVDFGHISMIWVMPDEKVHIDLRNLADPLIRQRMLTKRLNFFGPTTVAYRLSAYRSLPEGWSPAPQDLPSDLFMWRKFLVRADLSTGTRYAVTSAHLAAPHRLDWSLEQRAEENRRWLRRLRDPAQRDAFVQAAMAGAIRRVKRPKPAPEPARRRLARTLRNVALQLGWKPPA